MMTTRIFTSSNIIRRLAHRSIRAALGPLLMISLLVRGLDGQAAVDTNLSRASGLTNNAPLTGSLEKAKEKDPLIVKVMGLSIAILGTVLGIGLTILIVWCDYRKRRDLITFCHQERLAALEKGLELPPFPGELLEGHLAEKPKSSPSQGLKSGLMWLAFGISVVVYLSFQERTGIHPTIGAIPIAIGVVSLICYRVERRSQNQASDEP